MQLPIAAPAPIVSQHAEAFKDLFENQKQYRHFQNYLTGLIVLPNKRLANISRCILDSADKTNLSRLCLNRRGSKSKSIIVADLLASRDEIGAQVEIRIGLSDR